MFERGWPLDDAFAGATGDRLYGLNYLYQLYQKANPEYSGGVTGRCAGTASGRPSSATNRPILPACSTRPSMTSARRREIIIPRHRGERSTPSTHRFTMTSITASTRPALPLQQVAYEETVTALFDRLDTLDALLGRQRWLAGDVLTEADLRQAYCEGANLFRAILERAIMPDGAQWDPCTDTDRFTNPAHSGFWQPTSLYPQRINPENNYPPRNHDNGQLTQP